MEKTEENSPCLTSNIQENSFLRVLLTFTLDLIQSYILLITFKRLPLTPKSYSFLPYIWSDHIIESFAKIYKTAL